MGDTHTVARRRSPLRAVGRGAAHVLIAALPALAGAAPLASEAGRLPVAILSERAEDERREDLPDPLVALDLALDAIAAPALILGSDGRILRANAVARSTLAANAPAVRRALALVLAGGPKGRGAAGPPASSWDFAPLGHRGEAAGFLAIGRVTPPERALDEALATAHRRWKLTARQAEVLALVARGLTNDLIAETLGIGKGTVEFHLSGIFDKAGVSNRTTLIAQALR
jgi:DNA-binding CsgD family transcriptional regulator